MLIALPLDGPAPRGARGNGRDPAADDLLAGIHVLEAGSFIAAPLAAMTLGDWGADVVKLEPLEGDGARVIGPQAGPGMSATFVAANRGKRSVALDFRADDVKERVRALAAPCDVIIHNLPPALAARIGLDVATLRAELPAAVVCTVSAFGDHGPAAGRPGLDPIVQAMAGLSAATGAAGAEPVRCGAPIVDSATGFAAAAACLAALLRRERTGTGAHVSVSLLDVALAMQGPLFALRSLLGEEPPRRGNGSYALLGDQLAGSDGLITFVVWDDRRWRGMCDILGLQDLVSDPRYATNEDRCASQDELRPVLALAFGARPVRELEAAFIAAGIPCAVTQGLDAVVDDPQVRATGAVYVEGRLEGDPLQLAAPPVHVDGRRARSTAPPPALGAHTDTFADVAPAGSELANDR